MKSDYALPGLRTAYQDGSEGTTALLNEVLDAHGGLTQWKQFTKISATIRSGGDLWEMKGVPQDPSPRQMSASLDKEWSSVFPRRSRQADGLYGQSCGYCHCRRRFGSGAI